MTPTNRLRWLNIPERRGTLEEIHEHMRRQGCSYWYSLAVNTTPAKRVLQQWWEGSEEGTGEWRCIDEVAER